MQEYKNNHINEIHIGNNLLELNQKIDDLQINISALDKEIEYNYSENSEIKRLLSFYQKIKDNILN